MKRVGLKTLIILLLARAPFAQAVDAKPQASWHIEVVEKSAAAGGGLFSSLAIDTSGNLHLVYSNRSGKELRYAFRRKQDSRWDTATVDSLGGWFSSMAVDSQGHSHIAYNSPRLPGLYYATWDGTKWQKILIDPSKTGHQTSIQLDSQGNPRIAYYREEYSGRGIAKDLKYAYFDGKSWYIQTVDHRAGTGKWNSIALDQAGHPYITYSVAAPGNLGIAHLEGTEWERSMADSPQANRKYLDGASSLALDASNQPHIAYIDAVNRTVSYLWRQGSEWHQETIDSLLSAGADSDRLSMQLDHSGRPHLVFYDSGMGSLKYATRDDNGWHVETIDSDYAGAYASLCLDSDGQPYVSYSASVDRELRIAHRILAAQKP